ncbi:MAG: radical SAM/SPASM domain-containing protein [Candidatus Omnitrophica bacterium]|nr:radical SAM/SPASM domain-containing protein [Candidatus Omnitrophota bacterium]
MIHPILRAASRKIYSSVVERNPFLKSAWWSFREEVYAPWIRGEVIKVELSANCNARCTFCWMFQSEQKPSGAMTLENFKKFIDLNKKDFVKRRVRIQPFFNGEALTNPHFFDMVDYLVQNRIRLARLDTNLAVKKDMDRLMKYPWPLICVNVGGVSKEVHEGVMKTKYDILTVNLKRIFEINKKRVFVKVTPTRQNLHEIKQFPAFIKSLGGDPKRLEIGTTGFNTPLEAEAPEREKFFEEVVSPEVEPYLRFTYDLSKPGYDIKAKRAGCHFLQDCVTYDGKLTICCQDQFGKLNVGNPFETPFYELKASEEYRKTRQRGIDQKFKMCQECN